MKLLLLAQIILIDIVLPIDHLSSRIPAASDLSHFVLIDVIIWLLNDLGGALLLIRNISVLGPRTNSSSILPRHYDVGGAIFI